MKSLSSLFHRKSPSHGQDQDGAKNKEEPLPEQPAAPSYTDAKQPATSTIAAAPQYTAPQYAPRTGLAAHAQMVAANNIGMMDGAILSSVTGGNPVTGMIEDKLAQTW